MTDVDGALTALRSVDHWNHDTHDHRLIPRVAPPPYGRVLDVGCGEGLLTRRLAPLAREVTGVDPSAAALAQARGQASAPNVRYVSGDVLTAVTDGR